MDDNLVFKIKTGIYWSFIGQLFIKIFTLVSTIFLARILTPEDFGLLGLLSIFLAVSAAFVEGGFSKALIQKNDCTNEDYSTVFIFNLFLSIVFYVLLFFLSPQIAIFFEDEKLILISRIVSLRIIFSAFSVIQLAKLKIDLNFKLITKINLATTLLTSIISILAALNGFGYWSLVLQSTCEPFIRSILIWGLNRWSLKLVFNWKSFRDLFSFGSKLFIAGLYASIFNNVYNIIIGKYFSIFEVGLYSRASKITNLTESTISIILNNVSFPVLSSIKNDPEKRLFIFKNMVQTTSFLILPLMALLSFLSEPIIFLLLGKNWINAVPILKLIVFTRILRPISALNINYLNSIGRSDLYLKIDFAKLPIIIVTLIFTVPHGLEIVLIGQIINHVFFYLIDIFYTGKFLNYGMLKQLSDIKTDVFSTISMAFLLSFILPLFISPLSKIIIGLLSGIGLYIMFSFLFKSKGLRTILNEFSK